MLTVDQLVRVIKHEQVLGGSSRDSFSEDYACRAAGALELEAQYKSYNLKIEFARASHLNNQQEYLHPNISYY